MASTVYTPAQAEAQADDTTLNPAITEDDCEVHLTLVFRKDSTMGAVFDAVKNLGTVACDKPITRRSATLIVY